MQYKLRTTLSNATTAADNFIQDKLILQLREVCQKNKVPNVMTTAFIEGITHGSGSKKFPAYNLWYQIHQANRREHTEYRQLADGTRLQREESLHHGHFLSTMKSTTPLKKQKNTQAPKRGGQIIQQMWKHILLIWTE